MSRWVEWHEAYDVPDSPLARRLAIVQGFIADALDAVPPGPVRVISVCAGEARDLAGVLARHPRAADVVGRLVELDPELARRARETIPPAIEVRCGDAASTNAYMGCGPADLLLLCGIFGNVTDADVERVIRIAPSLCAPGATVLWTRHRRPPDFSAFVRNAFTANGFEELAFAGPDGFLFGVGMNRLVVDPPPFRPNVSMFSFVGYEQLNTPCAECGFVYDLRRAEIVRRLDTDARVLVGAVRALDDDAVRRRPAPAVWSPLEYACHVRDMLDVQYERVERVAREEVPEFTPMGRDERVVADRYNEQDPAVATAALLAAAQRLAAQLAALDDDGWRRTGIYNYPTTEARSVEWIGNHTVHELVHHAGDVGASPTSAP